MLLVDYKRVGNRLNVSGTFEGSVKPGPIEIVVNGEIVKRLELQDRVLSTGARISTFAESIPLERTSWIATRGFEDREDERPRFAHTAPKYFTVADKPLRPKREEVDYLIKRVADELDRHEGVLSVEALDEYRQALAYYEGLLAQ